jgi:hypothetical protein
MKYQTIPKDYTININMNNEFDEISKICVNLLHYFSVE